MNRLVLQLRQLAKDSGEHWRLGEEAALEIELLQDRGERLRADNAQLQYALEQSEAKWISQLATAQISRSMNFVECDTCRAKPGSPVLCDSCLNNRMVIERLQRQDEVHWKTRRTLLSENRAARHVISEALSVAADETPFAMCGCPIFKRAIHNDQCGKQPR